MATETNPTPTPTPTSVSTSAATPAPVLPAKAVSRAEQDQNIANAITEAGQIIETVMSTEQLNDPLASRGYDEEKLTEGKSFCTAAQETFTARQAAIAMQKEKKTELEKKIKKAKQTYTDFRETVRAVLPGLPDRGALGLNGKVPSDVQKLVTTARASYFTALEASFTTALGPYGWNTAAIKRAIAELDALSAAESAQKAAIGAAQQARAARDEAFDKLDAWMKQFRRIAKIALRDQPGLKRMIGV